jgi:hypothetical protein
MTRSGDRDENDLIWVGEPVFYWTPVEISGLYSSAADAERDARASVEWLRDANDE